MVRMVLLTILPILLYEAGALGFWCFTLFTEPLNAIHEVAWSADLAFFIPLFCFGIFLYQIYIWNKDEEPRKINVKRYERPKYEKYMRFNHHDMN